MLASTHQKSTCLDDRFRAFEVCFSI